MSTPTTTDQRATVRQLAATGMSHRAIGRQLGIHHSTVARILRTTDEPDAPATEPPTAPAAEPERATSEPDHATTPPHDAPPPPTSGAPFKPRLMHELPRWLIQDLNILTDPFTGRLDAPVARAIHAAAETRRATWRAASERRTRHTPRHDPAPAQ